MNLADLNYLQSALGQRWLAEVARKPLNEHNHLSWASKLRKEMSADQSHAVLETVLLRQRAARKFSKSAEMYFDRAGLEMSSAEIISTYRARCYAPFSRVADLCSGIGGDAIGLAQHSGLTIIDRDPIRLAMATLNVAAYAQGHPFTALQADLTQLDPVACDALFFDPARRDARGKRIYSIAKYQPSVSVLDDWKMTTRNWGIKVSPGVDLSEVPDDASVEFVSVAGDLREAVLWYGDLRPKARYTATLLPSMAQFDSDAPVTQPALSEPKRFVFEPDAAVIRAQLVQHLATDFGLDMLDPTIAYLTGDISAETPLARRFEVEAWFPFQLKRLRRYLSTRKVGRLEIKKRGSPLDPDQLRKMLKPRGSEKRTLILTRQNGNPIVIVCL